MRALLLGANGQLGFELRATLTTIADVVAVDRTRLDLSDAAALERAVIDARPDVLVNAAAHTDVDRAEADPAPAMQLNRDAVGHLGRLAKASKLALIHISTDFVFDGEATRAYRETDAPNPINVYGRSKLEGEHALLELDAPAVTLRTAWVYSLRRKSFVTTMLKLFREREHVRVVDDQIGNPTLARDLATAITALLARAGDDTHGFVNERRGVYHLAGTGMVSRHAFATAIAEDDPLNGAYAVKRIEAISSSEMVMPARRPKHAPLDCTRAWEQLGVRLPPWRESLERALAERTAW
jgi:dTDP-4-dehydrorhamnose reductase